MFKALSVLLITVFLPVLAIVATPSVVNGATATNMSCSEESNSFLGFPTWYKHLDYDPATSECEITFDVRKDTGKVLLAVVEILLRLSGIIATVFVIYGGFTYILTQGDPEKAKTARKTIINALVGVAIAIVATAAVNFAGNSFIK